MTALGHNANVSSPSLTNVIVIGSDVTAHASYTIVIGGPGIVDAYIGNSNSTILHVGSVVTSSDARFKYNIKSNVPGLDFIKRLRPVTYYFDSEKLAEFTKTGILNNSIARSISFKEDKQLHTGFLAQDVEKIANDLGYQFDGVNKPADKKGHYSLAYNQFIMPLVKATQEQQHIIEAQAAELDNQQKQIDILKKQQEELQALKATVRELSKTVKQLRKGVKE
ncbi:MAG: tail fiber domain-containing protein [Ferruginibacter sp.]